jgi:hypothetical protein
VIPVAIVLLGECVFLEKLSPSRFRRVVALPSRELPRVGEFAQPLVVWISLIYLLSTRGREDE